MCTLLALDFVGVDCPKLETSYVEVVLEVEPQGTKLYSSLENLI